MSKKPKRIPNPPGKCIFCGSGKLTKEHVFAEWMRTYLPEGDTGREHYTTFRKVDFESKVPVNFEIKKGKLHLNGDPRSHKLKCVCGSCNNGWMSVLQQRAKPILIAFITGGWPILSEQDQRTLAAWSAMFTMVAETADPKTISLSGEARRFLMDHQEPPDNWMTWIGSYSGLKQSAIWHKGIGLHPSPIEGTVTQKCNTQVTVFTANRLLVLTASSVSDFFDLRTRLSLRTTVRRFGLRRVWPTRRWMIRPPRQFEEGNFAPLMDAAVRAWGIFPGEEHNPLRW